MDDTQDDDRNGSEPKPPARLYGLWATGADLGDDYVGGTWWQHAGSSVGGPMVFESREDAEDALEDELLNIDKNETTIIVALIGVAPTGWVDTYE